MLLLLLPFFSKQKSWQSLNIKSCGYKKIYGLFEWMKLSFLIRNHDNFEWFDHQRTTTPRNIVVIVLMVIWSAFLCLPLTLSVFVSLLPHIRPMATYHQLKASKEDVTVTGGGSWSGTLFVSVCVVFDNNVFNRWQQQSSCGGRRLLRSDKNNQPCQNQSDLVGLSD